MKKATLFTGNFLFASVIQFLTSSCFYVFVALIPLYASSALNLSKSRIGILIGSFSLACVLVRPFAGALLDSVGRMRVYRPALLIFAVCAAGYILADSFILLFLLRIAQGVAWGAIGTAGPTVAADIIPQERRAEGLAYYFLAMSIGMALGPAIGVSLTNYVSYRVVFVSVTVAALLAFLVTFLLKMPHFEPHKLSFKLDGLFEKKVIGIAVSLMFYGMVYGGMLSFAIMHGRHIGMHNAGMFFLIVAFMTGITRPVGGSILDKRGPGHIIGFGLVMMIIGFIILSLSESAPAYYSSAIFLGVGSGTVMPPLSTMSINIVTTDRRGAAYATVFSAFDTGTGLGSILLGTVADRASIPVMFQFCALILVIPLIHYYCHLKKSYLAAVSAENMKLKRINQAKSLGS